jgi:hypothetical protein
MCTPHTYKKKNTRCSNNPRRRLNWRIIVIIQSNSTRRSKLPKDKKKACLKKIEKR